jgi:hypothetical protein
MLSSKGLRQHTDGSLQVPVVKRKFRSAVDIDRQGSLWAALSFVAKFSVLQGLSQLALDIQRASNSNGCKPGGGEQGAEVDHIEDDWKFDLVKLKVCIECMEA